MKGVGADIPDRCLQWIGFARPAAPLRGRNRRTATGTKSTTPAATERRTRVLREAAIEGLLERIGNAARIEIEILVGIYVTRLACLRLGPLRSGRLLASEVAFAAPAPIVRPRAPLAAVALGVAPAA